MASLTAVDSPTICNALEIATESRSNKVFTIVAFYFHAYRHDTVIIPETALLALPNAIDIIMRKERPLIDASKRAGFSVADLRLAMAEADDIH